MKKEELYELLGGIDEKYVEKAKPHKGAVKRGRALRIVIAAAFAVLLMAFVIVPAIKNSGETPILPPGTIDTPIVTDTTASETDEITPTPGTDELPPMGGTAPCNVHNVEYHSYDIFLIYSLNDDQDYEQWKEDKYKLSLADKSDCPYSRRNIYEFIKDFNIPKETMIDLYNKGNYKSYVNIDLLYSGTAEENDEYYRTVDEDQSIMEEYEKWVKFKEMKHSVMKKSKAEDKSMNWSVVQLAYSAGITDLSKVLPAQDFKESSTEFIYNADALSALPEKDIEEIIEKYTPYYLDCLVCGVTPYDTPYERQVALNAQKEQQ